MLYWGAATEKPLPEEAKVGKRSRIVPLKSPRAEADTVKVDLFEAPDEATAHILVAQALSEEFNPERMQVFVRPF